jgi:hypothetical protein
MLRSLLVLLALAASGQIIIRNTLDTGSVAVVITAPTSSATYDAGTASTITTLAGTSASDRQVTGCTWTNSLGGSGSATGTTSWSIASVALTVGSNVITITCTNNTAGTGQDVITVTRSAGGVAANVWVDNSCANNGDGTAVSCAASGGAAGAYNDLQSALTAAAGDDVIEVRENGGGDYVTTNGTGYTSATGFAFGASGTSGHAITLRNYPGERPVLRGCTSASTTLAACNRATLSAVNRSYITITSDSCPTDGPGTLGFHVYGLINFYDDSVTEATTAVGNSVTCTEIERGYSTVDDGNWSTLWLTGQNGFIARWNYIHDVTVQTLSGEGQQSSRAGVKMYSTHDSTIADNTIDGVAHEVAEGGNNFGVGLDCKADCVRNTFARNVVLDTSIGIRFQNQETGGSDWTTNGAVGSVVENSLFVSDASVLRGAVRFESGIITGVTLRNNTFIGYIYGLEDNSSNTCTGIVAYNNAFASITDNNWNLLNFGPCTVTASDYEIFTSSPGTPRYSYLGTNYNALSNLQSATSFDDSHSTEISNASFLFTNAGSGDYTLQAGSPLQGAGRVGGVSGGAAVDVGAYTDSVTCIGHTCG